MSNYLINTVKEKTEHLFFPVMKVLKKLKLRPNFLTLCSFLSGAVAVILLRTDYFAFFAVLSVVFDIFDGHLARYTNRVTELGAWLDHTSDRSVELLLILFAPVAHFFLLVACFLFILHQLLFIFVERTIFPARTILVAFFIFKLFSLGIYISIVFYVLGICWQLLKYFRKRV